MLQQLKCSNSSLRVVVDHRSESADVCGLGICRSPRLHRKTVHSVWKFTVRRLKSRLYARRVGLLLTIDLVYIAYSLLGYALVRLLRTIRHEKINTARLHYSSCPSVPLSVPFVQVSIERNERKKSTQQTRS